MIKPAAALIGIAFFSTPALARKFDPTQYVVISPSHSISMDLRYATANNFIGENVYGGFSRCVLHKKAAAKLSRASALLKAMRPDWKLRLFDCLRPRSVQSILFEKVRGTSKEKYVARPETGSIHNFGFALDVTLEDGDGNEIDMGTPFDSFDPLAQPKLESKFVQERKLSPQQLKNRHALRHVMTSAGFRQLPIEWWHYEALARDDVKQNYPIIEKPQDIP